MPGGRTPPAWRHHRGTSASHPLNQFELAGNASWEFDIWGKIRRQLEGAKASAQASEADLAAARLSAQATLASDYIELRIADEQRHLLEETVDAFKRSLQITENQYHVGVVAKADVITAQTQLGGAQSQLIAVGVTRATFEHAIAVLIGKAPADFAHRARSPRGRGAGLARRHPFRAPRAAPRRGRRRAADGRRQRAGRRGDRRLLPQPDAQRARTASPARWCRGLVARPTTSGRWVRHASDTLIDFGARGAQVRGARAAYDATVAGYRQTVLVAFQQVEDDLATLRILEQQHDVQDETVKSANLAVQLALNQYHAGTVAYTSVVTAQTVALGDAQTLLGIRQSRLVASVQLIQALGGGWDATTLGKKNGTAATLAEELRGPRRGSPG